MDSFKPSAVLAVDLLYLTVSDGALRIYLEPRAEAPFAGLPGLPGVILAPDEEDASGVARLLAARPMAGRIQPQRVATFAKPNRDPRARVVSFAWAALVPPSVFKAVLEASEGGLAGEVRPEAGIRIGNRIATLAFDHGAVVESATAWLRQRLGSAVTGAEFLEDSFTIAELKGVYEALLADGFDRTNFYRMVGRHGLAVPTGETLAASGRKVKLYCRRSQAANGKSANGKPANAKAVDGKIAKVKPANGKAHA